MGIFDAVLKSVGEALGGYDAERAAADRRARKRAEQLMAEAKRLAWAEADTGNFAEGYYVYRLGHANYEVRNSVEYTHYVEEGRAAGKRPPSEALRGWAERRGMLTGNENKDKGTLYVVARAIGRRGIMGKHILQRAKQNLGIK